ncbi:lasso peptide biosynthesis PqqD family chaperone [bacterium]|nr:MAG: lasso peptide biosynthesis PqqD family chaperone [bacterium]
MILPTTQVKASNDQVSCDLAGEAAILDLQNGIYYGLDPVGARIWELIQNPCDPKEIVSQLLDEYDVEAEQCQNDVLTLLNELEQRGLIEVCD